MNENELKRYYIFLSGIFSGILVAMIVPILWVFNCWRTIIIMTVIFTVFHIYCAFEELPRKPNKLNSVLKFSLIFPFLLTAYAKLYQHNGLISGSEIDHSFESAIYFSVITFTTLGYGDFQPTPDIRLWAAGEALIGYIVIAMLIGFTLNLLNSKFKNV